MLDIAMQEGRVRNAPNEASRTPQVHDRRRHHEGRRSLVKNSLRTFATFGATTAAQ